MRAATSAAFAAAISSAVAVGSANTAASDASASAILEIETVTFCAIAIKRFSRRSTAAAISLGEEFDALKRSTVFVASATATTSADFGSSTPRLASPTASWAARNSVVSAVD